MLRNRCRYPVFNNLMKCDFDNNEKDELWELLGKAPNPQPSQFFTQKVLSKVQGKKNKSLLGSWLSLKLLAPATAAVIALASIVIIGSQTSNFDTATQLASANEIPPIVATNEELAIEYLLFADLDSIMDAEESALWASASSF